MPVRLGVVVCALIGAFLNEGAKFDNGFQMTAVRKAKIQSECKPKSRRGNSHDGGRARLLDSAGLMAPVGFLEGLLVFGHLIFGGGRRGWRMRGVCFRAGRWLGIVFFSGRWIDHEDDLTMGWEESKRQPLLRAAHWLS